MSPRRLGPRSPDRAAGPHSHRLRPCPLGFVIPWVAIVVLAAASCSSGSSSGTGPSRTIAAASAPSAATASAAPASAATSPFAGTYDVTWTLESVIASPDSGNPTLPIGPVGTTFAHRVEMACDATTCTIKVQAPSSPTRGGSVGLDGFPRLVVDGSQLTYKQSSVSPATSCTAEGGGITYTTTFALVGTDPSDVGGQMVFEGWTGSARLEISPLKGTDSQGRACYPMGEVAKLTAVRVDPAAPLPSQPPAPSVGPNPTAESHKPVVLKTGSATIRATVGSKTVSFTVPFIDAPYGVGAGPFNAAWDDRAAGAIANEFQLDLPGITSGTYVNEANHSYVVVRSINSTVSYSAVNVGSCDVVIGRTPSGGVSGTVDCTVTGGYPANTWHAKGTFKAEP